MLLALQLAHHDGREDARIDVAAERDSWVSKHGPPLP